MFLFLVLFPQLMKKWTLTSEIIEGKEWIFFIIVYQMISFRFVVLFMFMKSSLWNKRVFWASVCYQMNKVSCGSTKDLRTPWLIRVASFCVSDSSSKCRHKRWLGRYLQSERSAWGYQSIKWSMSNQQEDFVRTRRLIQGQNLRLFNITNWGRVVFHWDRWMNELIHKGIKSKMLRNTYEYLLLKNVDL